MDQITTLFGLFTVRVIGAQQTTSQTVSSIFLCSPLPSGTWRTPGLSIPWYCLPTSSSVCLVFFSPFTVPCKMVLATPDKRDTCPYHCSLRLFTMVRRSLCGPIACWILAQTSSLVTWSLYEIRCILRVAPHFHGSHSSLQLWCESPWLTSIHEGGCDKGAHQSYIAYGTLNGTYVSDFLSLLCKTDRWHKWPHD